MKFLFTILLAISLSNATDVKELEKACDGGDIRSCSKLGFMYADGKGVKQDYFKAVELLHKSCENGVPPGCSHLGIRYLTGQGVKQDSYKAIELFQKACNSGYADGCYNSGVVYERGEGIKQDKQKALEYYGKACDLKNSDGCKKYAELNTEKFQNTTELISCIMKSSGERYLFSQNKDDDTIYLHNSISKQPVKAYQKGVAQGGTIRFYGKEQTLYIYDNRREMSIRPYNSTTNEVGNIFATFKCNGKFRK